MRRCRGVPAACSAAYSLTTAQPGRARFPAGGEAESCVSSLLAGLILLSRFMG